MAVAPIEVKSTQTQTLPCIDLTNCLVDNGETGVATSAKPEGWEKYQYQGINWANPLFDIPLEFDPNQLDGVNQAGITLSFKQDTVYTRTVDAQGITATQLKKAVFDISHYNKEALSLVSCIQLGTTQVTDESGKLVNAPIVHMAVSTTGYKAQWIIALLPPKDLPGGGVEIKWAHVPKEQASAYESKVNEFSGYRYYDFDVGGWKLENGQLTYWVSADAQLPSGISYIANNIGIGKNLTEMIALAKTKP